MDPRWRVRRARQVAAPQSEGKRRLSARGWLMLETMISCTLRSLIAALTLLARRSPAARPEETRDGASVHPLPGRDVELY